MIKQQIFPADNKNFSVNTEVPVLKAIKKYKRHLSA